MADLKISELAALAGSNLVAADELAIVDDSASETKKITVSDLIANGVTVISDDAIPGAKILFAAGDIATAALADLAVTTAKVNNDAITADKLANESTVDLVTTLPSAGAFTGQLAFDTDDNKLYLYNGSSWQSLKAAGSVNTVAGSTTGEINIVSTVSGDTATLSATIDNTTSAAQFLAGPTGSGGVVGYRTVVGSDLPTATTSAKGGVVVNGNGLIMDGDTIEINNAVTSSGTHHVVTYNANGLITGGRTLVSSDLPIATSSARGAVIPGDGLTVDVSGNLSVNNTVAAATYTKVTVTAQGLVSAGTTLLASDIPDHSAAKLTSGTIPTSILANSAVTGVKLADQATTKFGGALGSDNVTIFPSGDYKGQFFYDETTADLYIYTGSAYVPITLLSGNLVNAGVYNANTNLLSTVTTAGSSAGFTAGAALPAPTGTNLNHYVVVSVSGTGSGAAPAVALAPPDMLLSQGVGAQYSLIDVSNAIAGQTASNISVVAAGNIIATNVQSALQELDTEKLQLAGGTMTGDLNLGTGVDVVFEGSAADDHETTLAVTNPTADRTITLPNVTGTVVTTGDTGTVTSAMLLDGAIVNADINASAEIAVSKLANGTARQLLQTDSGGSGVEFTSNIDVPGTLDVTGAVTLDSTLATTGLISANGKISFPLGTAAAPSIYFASDTNTGVFSPAGDKVAITTAGTERVVVDASGNLGIGTGATGLPGLFSVHQAASSTSNYINITNNATGASAWSNGMLIGVNATGDALCWQNESSSLLFGTGNAERMRVDNAGRLLVGTTTEGNADADDLTLQAASGYTGITLRSGTTAGSAIYFSDATSGAGEYDGYILYGQSNQTMTFGTAGNGSPRMVIGSSGNVGIGLTNPSQPLSVVSSQSAKIQFGLASDQGGFLFSDSAGGFGIAGGGYYNGSNWIAKATSSSHIRDDGNGTLMFHTNSSLTAGNAFTPSERMRIDNSGKLLLGTTTVGFNTVDNLTIADSGDCGITIRSGASNAGSIYFADGTSGSAYYEGFIDYQHATGDLRFGTGGGQERMRITGNGYLHASPNASYYGNVSPGFHSFDQSASQWSAAIRSSHSAPYGLIVNYSGASPNSTSNAFIYATDSTRLRFGVKSNGGIENFSGNDTNLCDEREKKNIVSLETKWDKVKNWELRKFHYNEDADTDNLRYGVIAQEVETENPELITDFTKQRAEDAVLDEDGSVVTPAKEEILRKGVKEQQMMWMAIKALQEAMAKIETLETKVAALEAG